MFKNSNTNKRYYTLDYYYKQRYGKKVFKVSLNLNLTCPNIDGTKSYGGCIYCKNGSGEDKNLSLKEQFIKVKTLLHKKWPDAKYIAYFQANSNTYCSVNFLKEKVDEVLSYDNVCGINIATRCDCIKDDMLEYLKELNKKTDLVIELGLQTIKDETSKLINRAHTLKDTPLEKLYKKEKFHVLTRKEYVDIVCDELEYLNEDIVINRITGDPHEEDLIEPFWLQKKFCVLNEIDKELVKRNTYQGKKC